MSKLEAIEDYWTLRSENYSETVLGSIAEGCTDDWISRIGRRVDLSRPLKVLDIGTGPGFFPMLLGPMGHDVTAIDCTEAMLDHARDNCERAGVKATFAIMDAQDLSFEDSAFDLVISRNVVWNLEDPAKAYGEWLRVLRPGGKILLFDANHYLYIYDSAYERTPVRNHDQYIDGVDTAVMESIAKELPLSCKRRPQWDVIALMELGASSIAVDVDTSKSIATTGDRSVLPTEFAVCATKGPAS